VLKGISMDIDPNRPLFHLRAPQQPAVEVALADLKALFFVRSLEGNPAYNEDPTPDPADPRARGSTVIRIRFKDGETLVGLTINFPPTKTYFYMTPVDPKSNNIRMLVNRASVASMEAVR
jgi:hypothetical protein